MTIEFKYVKGATPLAESSKKGLIPSLSTQDQLNEFEQYNIGLAMLWAGKSRKLKGNFLSVVGLQLLHEKMFDQTWNWAGKFRTFNTNLGIDWHQISEEVHKFCGDVKYWIDQKTFPWPEIAVRFHHRLVSVHPFPNGNGRHSRLAADLLLKFNKQAALSWGGNSNLHAANTRRKKYTLALQEADKGDVQRLLKFAQSE